MMNLRENMVVIDGQIKTGQIMRCTINNRGDKYGIVFKNNPYKTYSYSKNKVKWLTNPVIFNPEHCHIYHCNRHLHPLSYIAAFQQGYQQYWYIEYSNGAYDCYPASEIRVIKSCLDDRQAKSTFEYLRSVAALNPLKADDDDTPLLLRQYLNIDFVGDDRAAAVYLDPGTFHSVKYHAPTLIFPFGCNAKVHGSLEAIVNIGFLF